MRKKIVTYCTLLACCLLTGLIGSRGFAQSTVPSNTVPFVVVASQSEAKTPKTGDGDKPEKEKEDDKKDKEKPDDKPSNYSVHGQATVIYQGNGWFRSPYAGTNSFLNNTNTRTSETTTLFLGKKLWEGGEVYFNPEVAGGRGLSDVHGIAGFPNGEIPRVGNFEPTPYIARLYYQQIFGLGGEQETVKDEQNQIAGKRDVNRITITLGKLAATDFFDENTYSHDPRTQFMGWSAMYNGAWDYPANTRGYTYGLAIELNAKDWALRYGIFGVPTTANGPNIDPTFPRHAGHALEFEQHYMLNDHPGIFRCMAFLNNADMGNYRESLALQPVDPVIGATGSSRNKVGLTFSIEQELAHDLGFFLRAGWNDDQSESWSFTEIGHTLAMGLSLKGSAWCREKDVVGSAVVFNGLSAAHAEYLGAGGLGFILGDGQIHYGLETIFEEYYNWQLNENIAIAGDFQYVINPAYNQDRGPVCIFALRAHFSF